MATFPFKIQYDRHCGRRRPRTIDVIEQVAKHPKHQKNAWSSVGEMFEIDFDIVASQTCLEF
jgi:hypothetical protein